MKSPTSLKEMKNEPAFNHETWCKLLTENLIAQKHTYDAASSIVYLLGMEEHSLLPSHLELLFHPEIRKSLGIMSALARRGDYEGLNIDHQFIQDYVEDRLNQNMATVLVNGVLENKNFMPSEEFVANCIDRVSTMRYAGSVKKYLIKSSDEWKSRRDSASLKTAFLSTKRKAAVL